MARVERGRHDGSFVIRIWWEQREGEAPRWRGQVQHVRDGRQATFSDLADLLAFIRAETGILPVQADEMRGLV